MPRPLLARHLAIPYTEAGVHIRFCDIEGGFL